MFSQVKKNESALERIRGYQGEMQIHPRKMRVCQIERTKYIYIYIYIYAVEYKPI